MRITRIWPLAIALAFTLSFGCGEDAGTEGPNIFTEPTTDAGTSDAAADVGTTEDDAGNNGEVDGGDEPDMDEPSPCDLTNCLPSQDCVEGVCVDRDPCDAAIDAGALEAGTPTSVTGSFLTGGADQSTASCGNEGQLEHLVRFEVTAEAEVSWRVTWDGQFDGLVALQTSCDDNTTETQCSDNENGSAVLSPGVYFLNLEVRLGNAGGFEVELTAGDPPSCTAGEATCDGDDRLACVDGFETTRETCPVGCSAGTCGGDSCQDAITVTGTGGTYSGTGRALTSTLDFAANTDCAQIGGMSTASPGYDAVFFLPGLFAGQLVSIDTLTNDGNVNDVYVQTTCGQAEQCTASYQNGEQNDFVVPANGDYFVIVEKRQASNAPFEYTITIQ